MSESIELSTKGLDAFLMALSGPQPVARVGILGGSAARLENKSTLTYDEIKSLKRPIRQGPKLDNADIGAIHEFGDTTHPKRSFLREPLSDRLEKEMEESGAFEPRAMYEVISLKSLRPWIAKIAILAEKIVLGGFASNGYGKWKAWKGNYQNNTGQILVDTTQLRGSITATVVDK